jgi:short-subunit dehydrogenase
MNKIAVVSGASSGIGFAIASLLQSNGFTVIGVSRSIPKQQYSFQYLTADLTKEEDVLSLSNKVKKDYGHIDLLVNCAGMGVSGAVEYSSLSEVKRIFDVNVFGTFLLSDAFIPLLRGSKHAKILNISSVAGVLSIPFQTFYSMTKASVNAFSSALALELKPFDISVCSVLPGDTQTNFTANREKPLVVKDEIYQNRIQDSLLRMEKDEQNGKSPNSVAKVILKLANKKHLPHQVTVGFQYKLFVLLNNILPKRFVQWILYHMYGK